MIFDPPMPIEYIAEKLRDYPDGYDPLKAMEEIYEAWKKEQADEN